MESTPDVTFSQLHVIEFFRSYDGQGYLVTIVTESSSVCDVHDCVNSVLKNYQTSCGTYRSRFMVVCRMSKKIKSALLK